METAKQVSASIDLLHQIDDCHLAYGKRGDSIC